MVASCLSCSLVVKVIYNIEDIENVIHFKAKYKNKDEDKLITNQ